MPRQQIQFARRYRAALLDYLLHHDENGLARAYDLGRRAVESRFGLMSVLRTHQSEVAAILEATHDTDRSVQQMRAAQDFLMEALSPFEMTTRGYVETLAGSRLRRGRSRERRPADPTV